MLILFYFEHSKVNLVCLPESKSRPADGQMCWTTGWGTTSSGGSSPDELHEVQVPVVSHKVCNAAYDGDIDGSMICAGLKKGGKDACQGDSGGPFVCGKKDGNVERCECLSYPLLNWKRAAYDKSKPRVNFTKTRRLYIFVMSLWVRAKLHTHLVPR